MTLSPIAGPLLSEQLELIREIARNLVGDAGPSGTRPPALESQRTLDGPWLGGVSSGDESITYGSAADRPHSAAASLSLFGLRPAFAARTDSAASQGAEIRSLIQLLAQSAAAPAPAAEMGTVAARERARPPGEGGRTSPVGEADAPPGTTAPRNGVAATPLLGGPTIASGDGHTETPLRSAIASEAPSGERAAALAAGASNRQARQEAAQATTRAAHRDPLHQAPTFSDKANAWTRGSAELASATNTVSTMLADFEGAVRNAIGERNLVTLGLGDVAAQMAAQAASAAPERAGVIASFILNAHFQPGWPPLRPIQSAQAVDLAGQLAQAKKLIASDKEMLIYLANFGVNIEQIARILKLAPRARHRSKLLGAILGFLVSFSTVVRLLQEELSALLDDLGAESQLLPRTASGKRLRTDLR